MHALTWSFLGRLAVPTAMIAAAIWYWMSLWDARMRDRNLILIQPVVLAMIVCYLGAIAFEIRRYRRLLSDAGGVEAGRVEAGGAGAGGGKREIRHILFMAVTVLGAALFPVLGAIPLTPLLILAGMLVLGVRSPVSLILAPLLTTLILWLVFIQGFGIRMPLFPS